MTETEQLTIWKSQFGQDWTDRNKVDPMSRVEPFKAMLSNIEIRNILEVGCGAGHNLIALSKAGTYDLHGIDPLQYAVDMATSAGLEVSISDCFKIPYPSKAFDLVFTCGVLMHISPEDIDAAVDEMARVSRRYILAIEYLAHKEEMILYRSISNLLWKRDYGKVFSKHGLQKIKHWYWPQGSAFAGCAWWIYQKSDFRPCEKSPIGQHHWILASETQMQTCKYCDLAIPIPPVTEHYKGFGHLKLTRR